MDTRSKILSASDAVRLQRQAVFGVTGRFDVLRAADARELLAVRERAGTRLLVAIVLPDPECLLSQRARAEIVAGLRVIDYVVIAENDDPESLIRSLQPAQLVRMETADRSRSAQLREHVRRRQTR